MYLQENPVFANDPLRTVIYDTLKGADNSPFNQDAIVYHNNYLKDDYQVRPFDQLSIKVTSFENNTMNYFNSMTGNSSGGGGGSGGAVESFLYLTGYGVDGNGMIQLPLIGNFRVEGLTTRQIQDSLDNRLKPYLNLPVTSVKLGNFRITLLGEVSRPGQLYVFNPKTTILQALGMGGDITDFGNIEKIKLIRETNGGVKSVYLDLSNPNLMISEYFYVKPNDVIYVEPLKAKSFNINSRVVTVGISSLSLILGVINLILNTRS
ncbi:MAG: polysaccharide biosynthesis/export family protein [Bacteroidetes bacterium]|nr:polysaccharide biosynthesis/export family protein [Bacteroidota bacterium]MCB0842270.1 polysaccharide biosynthesis/export family protein [Bacteroidota bacterium]